MPVTEFAILGLQQGHDEPRLVETLAQCQQLQDEWMHRNQPGSVESNVNFSSMYLERPNPEHGPAPSLLITAPWESAEAHGQWLQCKENQTCNDRLSDYIAPGGDSVLLFHMEPAGTRAQIRGDLFSRGTFNVCRISIDVDQRDAMQQAYRSLEHEMSGRGVQDEVWAGWRLETLSDAHHFVVFWTDDVRSEHLRHLMSFSDTKHHHRFRRVV